MMTFETDWKQEYIELKEKYNKLEAEYYKLKRETRDEIRRLHIVIREQRGL